MSGLSCQQLELYAAESSAAQGRTLQLRELQRYVDELREAPWWRRNFPRVLRVEAHVRDDSRRGSVGAWHEDKGAGLIEMAPDHLNELYVLHEVTHVLAAARYRSRSHDPWFARTYLEAVYTYLGSDAYEALRDAFDQGGVDHHTDNSVPGGRVL